MLAPTHLQLHVKRFYIDAELQSLVLALQRGVTVPELAGLADAAFGRLFLGTAKAVPPEAKWRSRAELNLSTR